jgi:hypothetical protein
MVRQRGQTPTRGPANFLPDDSNRYYPPEWLYWCITIASDSIDREYGPSVTGRKIAPAGFNPFVPP